MIKSKNTLEDRKISSLKSELVQLYLEIHTVNKRIEATGQFDSRGRLLEE